LVRWLPQGCPRYRNPPLPLTLTEADAVPVVFTVMSLVLSVLLAKFGSVYVTAKVTGPVLVSVTEGLPSEIAGAESSKMYVSPPV
jgi:hypothetical protein